MLKVANRNRVMAAVPSAGPDPKAGATVGDHAQARIAFGLRAMYDELIQQPLPERFVELLAQLDRKSPGDR